MHPSDNSLVDSTKPSAARKVTYANVYPRRSIIRFVVSILMQHMPDARAFLALRLRPAGTKAMETASPRIHRYMVAWCVSSAFVMKLPGRGKCSCTATLVDVGSVKRIKTLCLGEVAAFGDTTALIFSLSARH